MSLYFSNKKKIKTKRVFHLGPPQTKVQNKNNITTIPKGTTMATLCMHTPASQPTNNTSNITIATRPKYHLYRHRPTDRPTNRRATNDENRATKMTTAIIATTATIN